MKTYVVGTHKKRLIEALLMSIHNICFRVEIRKISLPFVWKSGLPGVILQALCRPLLHKIYPSLVMDF